MTFVKCVFSLGKTHDFQGSAVQLFNVFRSIFDPFSGWNFVLNFSYGTNSTLDESSLNESNGWAGGTGIDFNNSNSISGTVSYNINPLDQSSGSSNTTSNDTMAVVDDWNILDVQFQQYFASTTTG